MTPTANIHNNRHCCGGHEYCSCLRKMGKADFLLDVASSSLSVPLKIAGSNVVKEVPEEAEKKKLAPLKSGFFNKYPSSHSSSSTRQATSTAPVNTEPFLLTAESILSSNKNSAAPAAVDESVSSVATAAQQPSSSTSSKGVSTSVSLPPLSNSTNIPPLCSRMGDVQSKSDPIDGDGEADARRRKTSNGGPLRASVSACGGLSMDGVAEDCVFVNPAEEMALTVVRPEPIKCSLCLSTIQPTDEVYFKFTCLDECQLMCHKACLQNGLAKQGLKTKRDYKEASCLTEGCIGSIQAVFHYDINNVESLWIKSDNERKREKAEPAKKEKEKKTKKAKTKETVKDKGYKEKERSPPGPTEDAVVVDAAVAASIAVAVTKSVTNATSTSYAAPTLPPRKPNLTVPLPVELANKAVPLAKKTSELESKYAVNTQPTIQKTQKSQKKKKLLDIDVYSGTRRETPDGHDFEDLETDDNHDVDCGFGGSKRSREQRGGEFGAPPMFASTASGAGFSACTTRNRRFSIGSSSTADVPQHWDSDCVDDAQSTGSAPYQQPTSYHCESSYLNQLARGQQMPLSGSFPLPGTSDEEEVIDEIIRNIDHTFKDLVLNTHTYESGANRPVSDLRDSLLCVAAEHLNDKQIYVINKIFDSNDATAIKAFVTKLKYFVVARSGSTITYCKNRLGREVEAEVAPVSFSGPVVGHTPSPSLPEPPAPFLLLSSGREVAIGSGASRHNSGGTNHESTGSGLRDSAYQGSRSGATSGASSFADFGPISQTHGGAVESRSDCSNISSEVVEDALYQSLEGQKAERHRQQIEQKMKADADGRAREKKISMKLAQLQIKTEVLRERRQQEVYYEQNAHYNLCGASVDTGDINQHPEESEWAHNDHKELYIGSGGDSHQHGNGMMRQNSPQQQQQNGGYYPPPLMSVPTYNMGAMQQRQQSPMSFQHLHQSTLNTVSNDKYQQTLKELEQRKKEVAEMEEQLAAHRRLVEQEQREKAEIKDEAKAVSDSLAAEVTEREAHISDLQQHLKAEEQLKMDARKRADAFRLRAALGEVNNDLAIAVSSVVHNKIIVESLMALDDPSLSSLISDVLDNAAQWEYAEKVLTERKALLERGKWMNLPHKPATPKMPASAMAFFQSGVSFASFPYEQRVNQFLPMIKRELEVYAMQAGKQLPQDGRICSLLASELQAQTGQFNSQLASRRMASQLGLLVPTQPRRKSVASNRVWTSDVNNTARQVDLLEHECKICLDEMGDEEALCCEHCKEPYHKNCVRTWLATQATCPQCRRNFPDPDNFPGLSRN